jgi:hypothetical protein
LAFKLVDLSGRDEPQTAVFSTSTCWRSYRVRPGSSSFSTLRRWRRRTLDVAELHSLSFQTPAREDEVKVYGNYAPIDEAREEATGSGSFNI